MKKEAQETVFRGSPLSATLMFAGFIAFAAAVVYGYVGTTLGRRSATSPEGRRAMRFFALWWWALAANIGLVGVTYLLGSLGNLTLEVQIVDSYLQRVLLAISMVGLMQYLLYALTGRDLTRLLVAIYAGYAIVLTWDFFRQDPSALYVGAWRTDVVGAADPLPAMRLVSLAAIVLPPIIASALYFRLAFRVDDTSASYRIALVSGSIAVWWIIAVVAGQSTALEIGWLQTANRLLSLVAALLVLAAYRPPTWVQRRFGVAAPAA